MSLLWGKALPLQDLIPALSVTNHHVLAPLQRGQPIFASTTIESVCISAHTTLSLRILTQHANFTLVSKAMHFIHHT